MHMCVFLFSFFLRNNKESFIKIKFIQLNIKKIPSFKEE